MHTHPDSTTAHLEIAGELTIFTAQEMKTRLLGFIGAQTGNTVGQIEIDLTDVTDIDTAGLQLMLLAKREAAQAHITLRCTGHSHAVVDLLDLSNLTAQLGDQVLVAPQGHPHHD
ncbi:MAG: STAS domain-containing protein [Corticimicrobacter sp.]|uniref:STAS domain-containing protein n=1 Tax=Corticimicrobacter sp. TaxID=2678536 RepID=UPI0032DBF289